MFAGSMIAQRFFGMEIWIWTMRRKSLRTEELLSKYGEVIIKPANVPKERSKQSYIY